VNPQWTEVKVAPSGTWNACVEVCEEVQHCEGLCVDKSVTGMQKV
jgi:hypothetical protein